MLSTLKEIKIGSLDAIDQEVRSINFRFNSVMNSFHGGGELQQVNERYHKFLLRNISESITFMIIEGIDGKVSTISFYGDIKVSAMQLFQKYGQVREAYAIHDDLYFYFFNENGLHGNYSISVFNSSHNKINVMNSSHNLENISVSWPLKN